MVRTTDRRRVLYSLFRGPGRGNEESLVRRPCKPVSLSLYRTPFVPFSLEGVPSSTPCSKGKETFDRHDARGSKWVIVFTETSERPTEG